MQVFNNYSGKRDGQKDFANSVSPVKLRLKLDSSNESHFESKYRARAESE